MTYGDEWRLCRRFVHQTFRPESGVKFLPMQMRRAREMIINLIDDPRHYRSHFTTFSLSVVMSVIYDYKPNARDDPLVRVVYNALGLNPAVSTQERTFLLKGLSLLCRWWQKIWNGMERQDEASKPMFETALKKAGATAIIGSYETIPATLMAFALAMVLYPDVQRRAQAEVDSFCGRLSDDTLLHPWVIFFPECQRFAFTEDDLILGVPHAASSDDIYDGYFIPKGATVTCNTWAISRDEKRYPQASRFMPERFMDVNGALTDDNPADYVFGFGRRGCPGRHTADASIWSAIVTMLATVDFSSAKDDQGNVIDFIPQFMTGLFHVTMVFPCSILPRSHINPELVDV
ncbi:cytochrome P450 [Suillus ampliporus]|nr:cytochrome P450 [Suillus ampliporus]